MVFVDVGGDQIEIRVLTDAGQLAYVDDRIGPGGSERLLTDERVRDHGPLRRTSLGRDDWVARNVAGVGRCRADRRRRLRDRQTLRSLCGGMP